MTSVETNRYVGLVVLKEKKAVFRGATLFKTAVLNAMTQFVIFLIHIIFIFYL